MKQGRQVAGLETQDMQYRAKHLLLQFIHVL